MSPSRPFAVLRPGHRRAKRRRPWPAMSGADHSRVGKGAKRRAHVDAKSAWASLCSAHPTLARVANFFIPSSATGRPMRTRTNFVPAARRRPSFAKSQTRIRTKAPKPRSKALPKLPRSKGKRSAGRRIQREAASPRTSSRHPRKPSAVRRAPLLLPPPLAGEDQGGGALASRRSTAALAEVWPRLGSGPRFLESPGANGRTLPGASAASTSRTGNRPDGRCPVPPGRAVYGCVPGDRSRSASRSTLAKASPTSEMSIHVTETVTNVNENVTQVSTPLSSWPGLSRPSTSRLLAALKTWMPATSAGMTT